AILPSPGSVAPTRTPTASCASTSPRAPTSVSTAPITSSSLLPSSTAVLARPSAGSALLRSSAGYSRRRRTRVLRRPDESALSREGRGTRAEAVSALKQRHCPSREREGEGD